MKIGIDAKWFFTGNPSGKVVVRNLLEEFIKISPNHEIFVFLKKEERDLFFPFMKPHVNLVYIWGRNNQISNLFCIPREVRRLNIDVLLVFYFTPFLGHAKRVVFIFDAIYKTNPEYFTLREMIYFLPIRFLASRSNTILTISKKEKERLLKYKFGPSEKIHVIYLGISKKYKSLEYQSPEESKRIQLKYNLPGRYILCVGRLTQRKNIRNLLASICHLMDRDIKIVLAGGCDRKTFDLVKILKEYDIEDRVIALGYVHDDDLPILYANAALFCYISYDEGFGLPPLESLASGVPVVVANAGSLPEVCGAAGMYCDPSDPQDIASKIDTLLSDSSLYQLKREFGLQISAQFKWSNSAKKLLEVFEQF